MARKNDKDHATLYVRIRNTTYDQISAIAREGHRPIAAQVALVLEAWLKRRAARVSA